MAIETVSKLRLAGSDVSLTQEAKGWSAVGVYIVTGLDAVGIEPIHRTWIAHLVPGVPPYGDDFPQPAGVNLGITVIGKTARMLDPDKAEVTVRWGVPSVGQLDPGTDVINMAVGTTLQDVESNFGADGKPIYTMHAGGDKKVVGTVASGEAITEYRYTHVHGASPGTFSRGFVNSVNNAILFGEPNTTGCWRCSAIEGTKLPGANFNWEISYTLHFRPAYKVWISETKQSGWIEGWQAVVVETDPSTGQPYTFDKWKTDTDQFTVALVNVYPKTDWTQLPIALELAPPP